MKRRLEPELTDLPDEVAAYAAADFSDVNARFIARALELADEVGAQTLLDVGCGPGDITIAFAVARPRWHVVGADGSEPMLAIARERAAAGDVGNVAFLNVDAKALPDVPSRYDAIVTSSLLHHLPDPSGFWSSLRRVGRPGAAVLVRDLARPADETTARQIVTAAAGGESATLQEEFYRSMLAAFTPDELRKQLAAAGLGHFRLERVSERHFDAWGTLP